MILCMFRTVPLSIIRSFSLYTQQWYMSYRFVDSLQAGSEWNAVPFWSCLQAVNKPEWHKPLLCVQWKTPDDGQRNCTKHAEYHSKNKFEKLAHLVGFIIRNMLIIFVKVRKYFTSIIYLHRFYCSVVLSLFTHCFVVILYRVWIKFALELSLRTCCSQNTILAPLKHCLSIWS